jgi:hypothetical protein
MSRGVIKATLYDPMGPLWTRLAVPLAAGALLVGACVEGPLQALLFFLGPIVAFVNLYLPWRFRPRPCEVVLMPGAVRIREAGVFSQTLRARSVNALSVARTDRGPWGLGRSRGASAEQRAPTWSVAIQPPLRGGVPLVLDLATEADARRIREVLGVGRQGYGYLAFTTAPRRVPTLEYAGQFCLLMIILLGLGLTTAGGPGLMALVVAAALPFLRPPMTGRKVFFDSEQVRVPDGAGWRDIAYREIARVERLPYHIAFELHSGEVVAVPFTPARWTLDGMTLDEADHVVAQLECAARRAQDGWGNDEDDVLSRLAALRQGRLLARDWITRLDTCAQMMRRGGGYRGPTFEQHDLWTVLESPDADPELRGAAARILLRIAPQARVRVDAAVASMRDEGEVKRVRILLEPDAEKASDDLDAFDVRTLARSLER